MLPNGDNGVGAVIRGQSSEPTPRVVVAAGKVVRPCRSSARMKSGSSRPCSRVLSCCRSWQATCGRGCSKNLHSLNGGHAHHDACRDWEAPSVPNSPIFGWLSMEGILVCERKTIFTRGFSGNKLDHLWRSFGIKRGDDGVSEDQLRGFGKGTKRLFQTHQLIEAGCLA